MKQLIAFIIFIAFAGILFSQEEKTVYVIDGYTMESLTGFTAVPNSSKLKIRTDYNTFVTDAKSNGSVTISKEGYEATVYELNKNKTQLVVLQPTEEQILILRRKYIPHAVIEPEISSDSISGTTGEITENSEVSPPEVTEDDDYVLMILDTKAEFPGGMSGLYKFLGENIIYPESEIQYGITGRVYCRFVVEKSGMISDVKIIKGATLNMEIETLRVLELMPKWVPGTDKGIAVDSYYTLPITFTLQ